MGLKKTPLNETHRTMQARLVEFAGWEMPVQYSGVIEEHRRVRSTCGLFDVSHMGEIEVTGQNALEFVRLIATNDIARAEDGQCQYTLLCYPEGGVVDDCIVYRFNPERFLICVNASNTGKAFEWISSHATEGVVVTDRSAEYAQLALQGPASVEVLRPLMDIDPSGIRPFRFKVARIHGIDAIVSRTGYTGEDGFEIYLAPEAATGVWDALMESGKGFSIAPIGLGARDTLRLEMGYPLYGHELTRDTTPLEAGLERFVAMDKDFIGRDALKKQAATGVGKSLVGFVMEDPGVPREGYTVLSGERAVGAVTSGTLSPMLGYGIGMAYVEPALRAEGTELHVRIRARSARAVVKKTPFYSKKSVLTMGK